MVFMERFFKFGDVNLSHPERSHPERSHPERSPPERSHPERSHPELVSGSTK
jgi:hypothetical protein